jgi:phosphoribosylanthranilate isomerase
MTRVKICGITRKEDALYAIEKGACALGFIFYLKSERYIPPVKASKIVSDLPPFVDRVGVFVDMNPEGIINIVRKMGLSAVQLHGHESPEFCYELKCISSIPIIKAFRVRDEGIILKIEKYLYSVNAILLDTYQKDQLGGTGKTFNWDIAKKVSNLGKPVILSGGLTPENIKEANKTVKPYALDVNSGIEISPGIKDHNRINALFERLSEK